MNRLLGFVLIITLPSVPALNPQILNDIREFCSLNLNNEEFYKFFRNIIDLYEKEWINDNLYSNGFHLTPELCKVLFKGIIVRLKTSITFYSSENQIVLFAKFRFNSTEVNPNNKIIELNIQDIDFIPVRMQTKSVLWIKETLDLSNVGHTYEIEYEMKGKDNRFVKKSITTNDLIDSFRFGDQKILDINFNSSEKIRRNKVDVTVSKAGNYSLKDSYIIVCFEEQDNHLVSCDTEEDDKNGIYCKCQVTQQMATLFLFFIFWTFSAILTIRPVFKTFFEKGKQNKTDFPMMISCNQRNSKFEYILCIRLAKATPDFDLTDVNIDIEFLSATNENVAPVFRFKASVLEKEPITQIRIYMWRLTRLPELKKVQCCHSGRSNRKIMLFGVYIFCRKGGDVPELRMYRINRNITRERNIFNMTIGDIKDEKVFEEEEKLMKSLLKLETKYTFLETLWLLFVNITVISLIVVTFPSLLKVMTLESEMIVNLATVGFSALFSTVINFLLILSYRALLEAELRQQVKMNQPDERIFLFVVKGFYVLTILICVCIHLYIGAYKNTSQKIVQTYRDFCLVFCATNLFVFIWVFFSHSYRCISRTDPEVTENESSIDDRAGSSTSSFSSKNESRDQ